MKKFVLLVAGISLSSAALAENFEGLAIGVSAGMVKNHLSADLHIQESGSGASDSTSSSGSKASFVTKLVVEHSIPMDEDTVITGGITYDVNRTKLHDVYGVGDGSSVRVKNHVSVYVSPGIKINDDVLVYGKLSYHTAKIGTPSRDALLSTTVGGFGAGVGASYKLTPNVELGAELEHVVYGRKRASLQKETFTAQNELKLRSTSFVVGAKYRF